MRLFVGVAFSVCIVIGTAHGQSPPEAVVVGPVAAERRPIAEMMYFGGRIEAINRVDVRARVTGYLDAVLFREGDSVKEGAPLYRIEKGLFEASVGQAQGALGRGEG